MKAEVDVFGLPIYRQQPSTTDNNRQQPTTNLQLPTTAVNDPDQPTTSVAWLNILFIRLAKKLFWHVL